MSPKELATIMHNLYEEASVTSGWKTQESCQGKSFDDLPEKNKQVMLSVAGKLLQVIPQIKSSELKSLLIDWKMDLSLLSNQNSLNENEEAYLRGEKETFEKCIKELEEQIEEKQGKKKDFN